MLTSLILVARLIIGGDPSQPPTILPQQTQVVLSTERADTFQVLLSLTSQLDHSRARAEIIRPFSEDSPEMILVTAETRPADLERALGMLRQSRKSMGTHRNSEMRAFVPPAADPSLDNLAVRTAAARLSELQSAPQVEVPGYGLVRSIFLVVDDLP